MLIGENRALPSYQGTITKYATATKKPCIFLSHISLDKDTVIKIGNYIMKAGLDIYLDIYDTNLQSAVINNDDKEITKCIEKGIQDSTDVLCLLSNSTVNSWWVPYELGYGKRCEKVLATMSLKDLSVNLPSYIKITNYISGIKDLNIYIENILKRYTSETITKFSSYQDSSYNISKQASILQESISYHPLRNILNQ